MASLGTAEKLFSSIQNLSEISIAAEKLIVAFGGDKRYPEAFLNRFILINRCSLDFLEIKAEIRQVDYRCFLGLTTSKKIGVAPIYSPVTGKPFCDIKISGRYNEEVGGLLSILGDTITPEYSESLQLAGKAQEKPPIYLECCRFVDKYQDSLRCEWRKFSTVICMQDTPNSATNWNKYALDCATAPMAYHNCFENRLNVLSVQHSDYFRLNYVLAIALECLLSVQTPLSVRYHYSEKVALLSRYLASTQTIKSEKLIIHASDPNPIKELKIIGNIVLRGQSNISQAWRMDYAEFFERYVQYVFGEVARRKGCMVYNNIHYPVIGHAKPHWALSYIEPDLVLQKNNTQYVIDAKYKSHIYNWNGNSKDLKEDFRHDIHQIIAYTSFFKSELRNAILAYPFSVFQHKRLQVRSPLDSTLVNISMLGIPISAHDLNDTIDSVGKTIEFG